MSPFFTIISSASHWPFRFSSYLLYHQFVYCMSYCFSLRPCCVFQSLSDHNHLQYGPLHVSVIVAVHTANQDVNTLASTLHHPRLSSSDVCLHLKPAVTDENRQTTPVLLPLLSSLHGACFTNADLNLSAEPPNFTKTFLAYASWYSIIWFIFCSRI